MKTVTICGSMRFAKQMQDIAVELETKRGWCVFQPIGDANTELSAEDLKCLAAAHYKKIDLSDAVYIVNIGGYIGNSVTQELLYAKEHGKEIIFHEA